MDHSLTNHSIHNGVRKINCVFFVLILLFASTWEVRYLTTTHISTIYLRAAVLGFAVLGALIDVRSNLRKKDIFVFLMMTLYLVLYVLITRYNSFDYFAKFIVYIWVFFAYSLVLMRSGGWRDLVNAYADVLLVLGLITLFYWLFGSILNILPNRTMVYYDWADRTRRAYTYHYLYFENPVQNQQLLGSTFARNCGIFTEAPAFSGKLLIALGIEMFAREKVNYKRLVIVILVLLSTQSTKALLIMMIMIGVKYVFETNGKLSQRDIAIKLVLSVLLVAFSAFAIWYIVDDKSATSSYSARVNHLVSGLKTWRQNPMFGAGFHNNDAIYENQESGSGYGGLSMGLTILLATGGLYLTAFYVFAFFYGMKNPAVKKRRKDYCFFALMLLLNLIISNAAFGYLYMFFLGAAYASGLQTAEQQRLQEFREAGRKFSVSVKVSRPRKI